MAQANDEQLQRIAYEAQIYQQQGQLLKQQLDVLSETSAELASTMETLRGLASKKGPKLLPIGSGTFLRSKELDSDTVLINVGTGLVLELPAASAIRILEKREISAKDVRSNLQKNLVSVSQKLSELEITAQKLVGGEQSVRSSQE